MVLFHFFLFIFPLQDGEDDSEYEYEYGEDCLNHCCTIKTKLLVFG